MGIILLAHVPAPQVAKRRGITVFVAGRCGGRRRRAPVSVWRTGTGCGSLLLLKFVGGATLRLVGGVMVGEAKELSDL